MGDSHDRAGVVLAAGLTAAAQGRLTAAAAAFAEAAALAPDMAVAAYNLGLALARLDRLDEAAQALARAAALAPGLAAAHNNLGAVLEKLDRLDDAEAALRTALALDPGSAEAHNNLGIVLQKQGRLDAALAAYRAALAIDPALAEGHKNLGVALQALGAVDAAVTRYRHALALAPDYRAARYALGMAQLLKGDIAAGFRDYEARWGSGPRMVLPERPEPLWQGEDVAGRTVLVHLEQGWGDSLQFIRYAPLLRARGCRVVVECPPPLVRLFVGADGIDALVVRGGRMPAVDCRVALLSLPWLLGTTAATIPATVPYLRPPADAAAAWRSRLASHPGLKVGIAWRGNPEHDNDRNRSLPAAALGAATAIAGVTLISLQERPGADDPAVLAETPEPGDWADTAALVAGLDLVIAVDTAVAHLAGALGRPAWVLLPFAPDWRWQRDRGDSPWYPTLRLYRQPAIGQWAPVLAQVAAELAALVQSPATASAGGASTMPSARL